MAAMMVSLNPLAAAAPPLYYTNNNQRGWRRQRRIFKSDKTNGSEERTAQFPKWEEWHCCSCCCQPPPKNWIHLREWGKLNYLPTFQTRPIRSNLKKRSINMLLFWSVSPNSHFTLEIEAKAILLLRLPNPDLSSNLPSLKKFKLQRNAEWEKIFSQTCSPASSSSSDFRRRRKRRKRNCAISSSIHFHSQTHREEAPLISKVANKKSRRSLKSSLLLLPPFPKFNFLSKSLIKEVAAAAPGLYNLIPAGTRI